MPGKRGEVNSNIELWFLLGAFVLAGFAGFELLTETYDRVNGDLLEKNFIARDMALTIDALYASPGDVTYTYNLGDFRYYIDIAGGKVMVKSNFEDKTPVYYSFAGVAEKEASLVSESNPLGFKFLPFNYLTVNVTGKDCHKPSKLILSKRDNDDGTSEINIEGKNTVICNPIDEECRGKGVSCE